MSNILQPLFKDWIESSYKLFERILVLFRDVQKNKNDINWYLRYLENSMPNNVITSDNFETRTFNTDELQVDFNDNNSISKLTQCFFDTEYKDGKIVPHLLNSRLFWNCFYVTGDKDLKNLYANSEFQSIICKENYLNTFCNFKPPHEYKFS